MAVDSTKDDIDQPLNEEKRNRGKEKDNGRSKFWSLKSVRFQIGVLLCLNFFVLAVMRNNLGVGMVCMVNRTAVEEIELEEHNQTTNVSKERLGHLQEEKIHERAESEGCPVSDSFHGDYQGEFPWTSGQQGMLFAAMYWGSFSTLLAGWLSDRYNPKMVMLTSGVLNVLGTVFSPVAAQYGGYPAMFAVRLIAGIGQGFQRPSINAVVARWYPVDERSTVVSLYTTGNQLSSIISTPLFAWMCTLRHALGWPLIFYTSAGLGVVWCLLWQLFATNQPEQCRRISDREKEYIESKLDSQKKTQKKDAAKHIPWRKVFTSLPVIACIVCGFANGMVLSLSGSYVPTYFMNVLYMDLKSNGLFSTLPFVIQWAMKFVAAAIADHLLRNHKCKPTLSSKVFNSIASFGTGGFLFGCSFLTCNQKPLAIALFCIALGFFGVFASGYWTSMVNIAPVYAGTICALATTSMTVGAIVAPYLVGGLVVEGSREEWRLVFGIIAGCLLFSGLFYLIFGSAEVQSWAKEEDEDSGENERKHDEEEDPKARKDRSHLEVDGRLIPNKVLMAPSSRMFGISSEEKSLAELYRV